MNTVHRVLERVEVANTTRKRVLAGFTGLVYLFLYAPIAIVILLSFTESRVPTFPMDGFTFKWYAQLLPPGADQQILGALLQSVQIAVISALGAGLFGTITALGMVRSDFKSRWLSSQLLNTLFLAPIVVPWVVTGIAMLTLYNIIGIQGSFLSVVIGHIIITMPFVIMVVSSRLYGFDRELEEAAKNLGASELRTFYEVTLPLIAPGIIAGMLFAFTISFDNFTQTFFWVGTGTETLPIVIYSKIRTGLDPTINAIGTLIVLFSLSIAVAAEKLSARLVE
ncbi:spermidine/putrescine transport system permease protein [Halogranum amylolyticum]|uniref:Spermidine/putrescine transport system permease protein n=1 Tax=Halogranum amylolyticum TaxID=660520 RepID=A0A1H8V6P6_9EURY|nr:ABC transporter permease [Halogranum amylolyticum]SEP11086.1 spermidine/putrescine transport system permease protein [Halogranum amylolyticum]